MKRKLPYFILLLIGLINLASFSGTNVYAEDTSLQDIKDKGELVVGTSADYPPFEFHANVDGEDKIVGFEMDMAQRIADELGVELKIEDIGFDSLLPAMESGTVDMIISGMSPTPERQESVDFSQVYYNSTNNFVIRQEDADEFTSVADFNGSNVGVQTGSLQEQLGNQVEGASIQSLTDIPNLILSLKTGKIDAVILGSATAEAYVANNPDLVTFVGDFEDDEGEGVAIAMNQGSDALVAEVDRIIDEINADGSMDEYLQRAGQYMDQQQVQDDQNFFQKYLPYYWDGVKMTLLVSIASIFFGVILGTLVALMRNSNVGFISGIAQIYTEFIRGTPLMIQVMFVYFAIGSIFNISAVMAGIIAVSLNSGAYVAEIIRSGLNAVPKGQSEAARSLGLSQAQTMRHVIFPQSIRTIWPSLGNEFITIIKESSIVSVIGVAELTFQARIVSSVSYQGILSLTVSMITYFILTYSLTKLLNYAEGKLNYD